MTQDTTPKRDEPFTVTARGSLDPSGLWRIAATLRFREGLKPQPGDQVLGEGRLALVMAIAREGLRGRVLGCTSVRVHMDVDGEVNEVAIGDLALAPESLH